ncbi:MBL fold metallo-hydrolase [Actinoplanes sp. CA-015351]|uniref:MBL fold metallo-hydrolase n=1 Tax=Actinoplanes sp. CA-015351 TaxID=3239897 RepID=UPI003D96160A
MGDFRLSRRFVITGGSGVFGVAVLNTLTGCSSDPAPPAPAASSAASPAAPAGNAVVGDWQRVNLSFVSVYLLIRGNEIAVVDTGTSSAPPEIEAGLKAAGFGWDAVKHVIVTHRHQDHAGGLAGVAPAAINGTIYTGDGEVAEITASKPLQGLKDGDEIFGLQIIGTPGHTPGHISVFEPATGVLVTGDALNNTGELTGANPQYTADMTQAAASVKKLAGLDVKAILPGHGEPLTTGAADALRKLAATL